MEAKQNRSDELYQLTIEAKSDAVLSVIGKQILDGRRKDIDRISEKEDSFCLPHEIHGKIAGIIQAERKRQLAVLRMSRIKKLGKVCAMLLLVLGLSGTILIHTSEAFRYRFDNFWVEVKTEYLGLKPHGSEPGTERKGVKTLSGLWYPGYLPNGFQYTGMSDLGAVKKITFQKEGGDTILLSETEAGGSSIFLDNEADESGQVKLSETYDGYWVKNGGQIKLVWLQSDLVLQLNANLELSEIVKIAESMEFKK